MYYVYMIKNAFDDLYIGISADPVQRLKDHNSNKGALYTKRDSQFEIVFLEKYSTLSEARQREIQLKKWNRKKKEFLIKRYQQGEATTQ